MSRTTWVLGLGALAVFVALGVLLAPLQPNVVALQLALSGEAFAQVVHAWSPDQMARFRAHLLPDGLLMALYAGFGWRLAREWGALARLHWARWLLPGAALADAAENGWHAWLTAAPRLGLDWPYPLAASCALLKWAGLLGFAAAAAWAAWRSAQPAPEARGCRED